MQPTPFKPPVSLASLQNQLGAYTIEFAFIFIMLCLIVYGLLTFGMAFAAQQSINLATQEAARSLTRFQAENAPTNTCLWYEVANSSAQASITLRAERAVSCALDQAGWIEDLAQRINQQQQPLLHIAVCGTAGIIAQRGQASCSNASLRQGEYELSLHYDFSQFPLIPNFGLLSLYNAVAPRIVLQNQQRIRTSETQPPLLEATS